MTRDTIYTQPLGDVSGFTFNDRVVKVFPDMIERSVPGYQTIISAIGLLADKFSQTNSHCYDLGCSLGAATYAMRSHIQHQGCRIISVDNSQPMLDGFQKQLKQDKENLIQVDLVCADIRNVEITNASVVVLNFTLQFIPVDDRGPLLKKIYDGLLPGGILILSEKLVYQDPQQHELHIEMHELFKIDNGYSELEVAQKRTSLENVLIPETLVTHKQRLESAGFQSAEVWFQYFNFASLIALK